ncbi:MAG: hypothetical protein ACO3UU_05845 [Minisyncoccia bacterium]
MSQLLKKQYSPEDIFKVSHWTNRLGSLAIGAEKNRREAEAIMLFGQTYFPEHFPSKHPTLHTDILSLFCSDNSLKAVAVPRGHSKSTLISFLMAIYRIVFKKRKFIVIVSDSEDKAKDFVIRLRDELEHNVALKRDFTENGSFKTSDWSKTDFITSTGIRVIGKGSNQSLRGSIHLDSRPDCIILDDIETNETAGSSSITNFILTDVIPSANRRGTYDICYIGTIIKDMSCLHRMLINTEWCSAKWECTDDSGEMIAPMLLSRSEYDKQKRMYMELGKMSIFYAENHNNPMVADDEMTFKEEYFQRITSKDIPIGCNCYIAYDPAMPPSGRTKVSKVDRSCFIVLHTDSNHNWYVSKVIANRDNPSNNRKLLFSLVQKYKPNIVYMETIAAQRGMYMEIQEEMKRNNMKFVFKEIPSHSGSKEARIEQLQPLYQSGRIYHIGNDVEVSELERELLLFGRTPHDDRSDTLSFFLNRVKYPAKSVNKAQEAYDMFDRMFKKQTTTSWKLL